MIRRIFSYMHQYKKYAVTAVFCVVAESIFELIVPLLMADMVDVGVATGDRAFIFQRGGLMMLCALLALALGVGSSFFGAMAGQGLGAELRKEEYRRMQGFSFSNIDHFRVSSLVTRMTSDVANIQNAVASGMRPAVRGPVMLVLGVGLSFWMNGGCSRCTGKCRKPLTA